MCVHNRRLQKWHSKSDVDSLQLPVVKKEERESKVVEGERESRKRMMRGYSVEAGEEAKS